MLMVLAAQNFVYFWGMVPVQPERALGLLFATGKDGGIVVELLT